MTDPANETSTPPVHASNIAPANASETEQITGGPPKMDEGVAAKWRPFHESLTKRRNELIDAVKGLEEQSKDMNPSPLQEELADAATTTYHGDELRSMVSYYQTTLVEIDDALSKMQNGTYGICELTGEPISEDRLKAIPWARFSLEGEKQMEARGQTHKVRLGGIGEALGNVGR